MEVPSTESRVYRITLIKSFRDSRIKDFRSVGCSGSRH